MNSLWTGLYDRVPVSFKRVLMRTYATYLHTLREGQPMELAVAEIERVDRLERDAAAAHQLARINDLLAWADQHVPWYRGRVLVGSGPGGRLASLEEIEGVPVLTKREVRDHGVELTGPGGTYHGHTSGTTGTPLQLRYDRSQLVWNRAAEKVVRRRAGLAPDARAAVIWGRAVVPRTASQPPYWIANDADREIWLSAFHVSRATAPLYFDAMRRFGAVALETYPSLAYLLARLARESRTRIRLQRVLTS